LLKSGEIRMTLSPNHFEGGANISPGHRKSRGKILPELLDFNRNNNVVGGSLIRHHPDGSDNNAISSTEFDDVDNVWFNIVEPQAVGQDLEIHFKFTLPSFFTKFDANAFEFQAKVDNSGGAAAYQIIKIYDTDKVAQTVGLPPAASATSLSKIILSSSIGAIAQGTYSPKGTILVVFLASGNLNDKIKISNEAFASIT